MKKEELMNLENKKILMIIAPENYRDEEFEIPYKKFVDNGASVTVASLRKGKATGMFGSEFHVDTDLSEVEASDYDAIVFIGGAGVPSVRADKRAVEIAGKSVDRKVLAAICWAPTILAKAGAVKGKKTTVWLGDDPEYKMKTNEIMTHYGADFAGGSVVEDGNIITGNGPDAAEEFALKIINKLAK
jgi:protease I